MRCISLMNAQNETMVVSLTTWTWNLRKSLLVFFLVDSRAERWFGSFSSISKFTIFCCTSDKSYQSTLRNLLTKSIHFVLVIEVFPIQKQVYLHWCAFCCPILWLIFNFNQISQQKGRQDGHWVFTPFKSRYFMRVHTAQMDFFCCFVTLEFPEKGECFFL